MSSRNRSRRNIFAPSESLVLPHSELLLPVTPHQRRMSRLGRLALPRRSDPDHEQFIAQVRGAFHENSLAEREIKKRYKLAFAMLQCNMLNGSGLLMARILREQLYEASHRIWNFGIHALPSQFNIFEAFFDFNSSLLSLGLLGEHEFLLHLDDFLRWYGNNRKVCFDRGVLKIAMREGEVYSFNMVNGPCLVTIPIEGATLVVGGVSLVRHGDQITCVVLLGENPPAIEDNDIPAAGKNLFEGVAILEEDKKPLFQWLDNTHSVEDRYLNEFPGYARVHLLQRFDLRSWSNECWYLARDNGHSFDVFTNDRDVLCDLPMKYKDEISAKSTQVFQRYTPVVSMGAALVYLPVAFTDEDKFIHDKMFRTDLKEHIASPFVRLVRKNGFERLVQFDRKIGCLATSKSSMREESEFPAPDFEYKKDGYWKVLDKGDIGEDEEGNPISGKTWVSRSTSWVRKTLDNFLVPRSPDLEFGPGTGFIYVMRCPGHSPDVYKIGLTQNTAEVRASQLSGTTSSPLPFGVLASWLVTDCAAVESAIHKELDAYRINPRREFFRIPLTRIISTSQRICDRFALRRSKD